MSSSEIYQRLLSITCIAGPPDTIFRHEQAAVPLSLFHDDSAVHKTSKSQLAGHILKQMDTNKTLQLKDNLAQLHTMVPCFFIAYLGTMGTVCELSRILLLLLRMVRLVLFLTVLTLLLLKHQNRSAAAHNVPPNLVYALIYQRQYQPKMQFLLRWTPSKLLWSCWVLCVTESIWEPSCRKWRWCTCHYCAKGHGICPGWFHSYCVC